MTDGTKNLCKNAKIESCTKVQKNMRQKGSPSGKAGASAPRRENVEREKPSPPRKLGTSPIGRVFSKSFLLLKLTKPIFRSNFINTLQKTAEKICGFLRLGIYLFISL
jgi:hypothetical protein